MTLLVLLAVLQAVPSDTIVARVGEEAITAADVSARLRPAGRATNVIEALDELVSEVTLARAARAEKLPLDAAAKERLAAERRSLAVQRMLQAEVLSKVSVTDAQVKELFHAANDEVRLALVVRGTREEAQGVVDRLAKGGSLSEEVKASIDARSRERGGDLPWMKRAGFPPELAKAAFSAPLGRPAGPFATGEGFAVIVVRDRKIAEEAELAQAQAELRAAAEAEARDAAMARYMDELRGARNAKVDAAALAHGAAAAKPTAQDLARPVATAGKLTVTLKEVKAEVRESGAAGAGATKMSEAVAARILDRKLLEQVAAERGYAKDAQVSAAVRGVERALLAQAYAEKVRKGVAAPAPAEVEARYEERQQDFVVPARRRCWQVVARSEDAAATLRKRIAGGEPFEKVANESVNAPTASKGGLIGEISEPELDAIAKTKDATVAAAIRKLGAGELSAPVADSAGEWHVFRCDAPLPARTRSLDEVRAELTKAMQAEKARAAVQDRTATLRKTAAVTIDDSALGKLSAERKAQNEAMHGGMPGGHGGMPGGRGDMPGGQRPPGHGG